MTLTKTKATQQTLDRWIVDHGIEARRLCIFGIPIQAMTKEELQVALVVSQKRFTKLLERMNRNDLL